MRITIDELTTDISKYGKEYGRLKCEFSLAYQGKTLYTDNSLVLSPFCLGIGAEAFCILWSFLLRDDIDAHEEFASLVFLTQPDQVGYRIYDMIFDLEETLNDLRTQELARAIFDQFSPALKNFLPFLPTSEGKDEWDTAEFTNIPRMLDEIYGMLPNFQEVVQLFFNIAYSFYS